MSHEVATRRLLNRSLRAAAAVTALAACSSDAAGPGTERSVPTFRITGVTVQPIDRIDVGSMTHYVFTDTLRGQIAFSVTTHAVRLPGSGPASAPAGGSGDEFPGYIANPTVPERSWLSVDRPVRHRGVEIPANANLLAVEAIRTSFDGSFLDLPFSQLSPFGISQVHLRTRAFELAPGPYVFTFRWETAEGEAFGDTVPVYIDLTRR